MLKHKLKDLMADEYNQKHYSKLLNKLKKAGIVEIHHSASDYYGNELRYYNDKYNNPKDKFDGYNKDYNNMYQLTP